MQQIKNYLTSNSQREMKDMTLLNHSWSLLLSSISNPVFSRKEKLINRGSRSKQKKKLMNIMREKEKILTFTEGIEKIKCKSHR